MSTQSTRRLTSPRPDVWFLGSALLLLALLISPTAQAQVYGETAEATAVRQAIDEYQQTGVARVLEVGQTIIVPFGQVDPVLKTAVLRTTLIELDRNEYVIDRIVGDSLRWSVDFATTGKQNNFRQLISVKPKDQDITTSLVLTTNFGRIYQFMLDSEPYPIEATQNPVDIPYTRHVKFYYPDGASVQVAPPEEALREAGLYGDGADSNPAAGAGVGMLNVAQLNTSYEIDADPAFPCPPSFVADDGTRLIVQFPDAQEDPLCSTRFPLYAVDENSDLQLLNYEVFGGNTYIADRIPAESVLLYHTERKQRREVRILNRTLRERLSQRRPSLTESVFASFSGGVVLPMNTSAFNDTYRRGYHVGAALGAYLDERFSAEVDFGYARLPLDGGFVGDAVEAGLNETFGSLFRGFLENEGEIGEDESVEASVQAGGANVTDLSMGLNGRFFLAERPRYGARRRIRPYVEGRLGLTRRRTEGLDLSFAARIREGDGSYRTSSTLEQALRFTEEVLNDPSTEKWAEVEQSQQQLTTFLNGGYDSEYVLPDWLFSQGTLVDGTTRTFLGLGFSFGFLVDLKQGVALSLEGGYQATPLTDRAYKGFIPIEAALQLDL